MDYTLVDDFAQIDLTRHAIIEASAGTGKTYTLENLVVRLLKERQGQLQQLLNILYKMAYQIPQQLMYKEKIMFGLTFKQLLYAFIFGLISLIIFRKIDNMTIAVIIASIPSVIGLGFIFFNLEEKIKDYISYLRLRELKRDDTRELSKKIKGTEKEKIKRYVYNYRPKDKKAWRLRIEIRKQSVEKGELIEILEEVIEKLRKT